jgi:NADP-dependent 3-hydroxy acid dehydrogenase YdfG
MVTEIERELFMKLEGKTALVTGGSTGLGFATAKALLKKGMKVTICGRTEKTLIEAAEKLDSDNLQIFVCDVREYEQVEQMVSQIGEIDVLINNAGLFLEGPLNEYDPERIAEVTDVNLKGAMFVVRAVLPEMENNGGFIVNVSSIRGKNSKMKESVYVATKFGLRGFTDSLREEYWGTKVRILGFYPGGMDTSLYEKAKTSRDMKSMMDPDDIAEVIVFMLTRGERVNMDDVMVNKRIKI